jgi:hypothetical protein
MRNNMRQERRHVLCELESTSGHFFLLLSVANTPTFGTLQVGGTGAGPGAVVGDETGAVVGDETGAVVGDGGTSVDAAGTGAKMGGGTGAGTGAVGRGESVQPTGFPFL